MKKAIALFVLLAGLLLGQSSGSWPGTYPLTLFDNVLLNATAACTSSVFSIPQNATGFFAIQYAAVSATGTAEYQMYYEVMYPRLYVPSATYTYPSQETFNWDTVYTTPPLGVVVDSFQTDTAGFEPFPGIRGAKYRVIFVGLTNNPADTRVHARLIADIE